MFPLYILNRSIHKKIEPDASNCSNALYLSPHPQLLWKRSMGSNDAANLAHMHLNYNWVRYHQCCGSNCQLPVLGKLSPSPMEVVAL